MPKDNYDKIQKLRDGVLSYGLDAMEKRFEKLKSRRFVLFPVLRAKMMLKRITRLINA